MRLWMVSRTDGADYDEYSAMVVRATTADKARELVLTRGYHWDDKPVPFAGFTERNIVVEPLSIQGDPGVVLGSFHAG